MKRGEIWLVNLNPVVGSEIRKTRPCVIVSPPEMNQYLRSAIVAPMTTKSHPAPFRIEVKHAGKKALILLDQIRTVDQIRLVRKLGALQSKILAATLRTLQETFAE